MVIPVENEFHPDPSEQAQQVIFTRKTTTIGYSEIFFNNIPVSQAYPYIYIHTYTYIYIVS